MRIVLPWPPATLSPNSRRHWAQLAKAKKAYRSACHYQAVAQGAKSIDAPALHVSLKFFPPDRRQYDLDNLLARMKSGLDGIAEVVGVDDRHWSLSIERSDDIGGFVEVLMRPK